MDEHDKVISYIMDQANRYDIDNMQFEQDIIQTVKRNRVLLASKISSLIRSDIRTLLQTEQLMTEINRLMVGFCNAYKKLLLDKFKAYADRGHECTGDLIELGNEVSGKIRHNVKELKQPMEYDPAIVDYIQKHAFEQIGSYATGKVDKMRAAISDLMLNGKGSKSNVRDAIEKILEVDKAKAEEITQYELSRAYSYGTTSRLKEYARISGEKVKKYWHGFKYSDVTCEYCREHIGMILDIDDDEEVLPAHIRCRCVWLPVLESWETPVTNSLIAKANMLNTAYSKDMIYQRINTRLGINYADYMSQQSAVDYLSGDRSQKVINALSNARAEYISDIKTSFNIPKDTTGGQMSTEYNSQMNFWQNTVAGAIADKNGDLLSRSTEAIKGVMLLPWTAEQLDGWNTLLSKIGR